MLEEKEKKNKELNYNLEEWADAIENEVQEFKASKQEDGEDQIKKSMEDWDEDFFAYLGY
jgi:hypothetical protein